MPMTAVLILDALILNLAMILARFNIGLSKIESRHLKLNLDGRRDGYRTLPPGDALC